MANEIVADVIRTVQARGDSAGDQLDTAMVVIAAEDIPAGREVRCRWDYDHQNSGRLFRRAMMARGVPAEALDSREYAAATWTMAEGVMGAGTIQRDEDFPYATVGELGLCVQAERARTVVREARTSGRKRVTVTIPVQEQGERQQRPMAMRRHEALARRDPDPPTTTHQRRVG